MFSIKKTFDITGMTCAACSARIERAVKGMKGINDVQVNLLTNSMTAEYDDSSLKSEDIVIKVKSIGYGAQEQGIKQKEKPKHNYIKIRLILSIIILIPLLYVSMGHMIGLPQPPILDGMAHAHYFALYQLILTLIICGLNYKYFTVGFKSLFRLSPNMDSLIAVGASAALIYGFIGTYYIFSGISTGNMELIERWHMDLYFESAATILTLVDIGKYLESFSKGKTRDVLDMLTELAPETAVIIRDGKELTVHSSEIREGDIISVKPGTKLPVDGVIVEGSGFLDQSALTGESMPIEKSVGDNVLSASVNTAGAFKVKATRVGDSTTLSQMIKLSLEAAGSKAPISRLADRVSSIFVPVVMAIALVTGVIWYFISRDVSLSLNFAVSVLVVSCPCALGLATPVAIMVGTGQGAKNGLLYKSAAAMEKLSEVNAVVFDKTGTLTKGMPELTDIIAIGDTDENYLLSLATALEKNSEHPLGTAIVTYARKMNLADKFEVTDFKSYSGSGISGKIDGITYYAGNMKFISSLDINCEAIKDSLKFLAQSGKTPMIFADEKTILGIVAVADKEKANSSFTVSEIEKMNIDCVMLTGDNETTAKAIGKKLGVKKIISDVLPQNKSEKITELQQSGKTVAMVGDGINDAPALAKADVGIAVGDGTDIAIESADIVLLNKDIFSVATAIKLSKKVIGNIKMNLFWAFFYNSVSIPVAAGVFYGILNLKLSPMLAAAAMSLSSVCVCLNALRLRSFRAEKPITLKNEIPEINTEEERKEETELKKIINITGMSCNHCAKAVEDALLSVEGVRKAKADFNAGVAVATMKNDIDEKLLIDAIEKEGFKVGEITIKEGLF